MIAELTFSEYQRDPEEDETFIDARSYLRRVSSSLL